MNNSKRTNTSEASVFATIDELVTEVTHASRVAIVWFVVSSVGLLSCASVAVAAEDIEFVAEHLAEVQMDNRYGTLPIWGAVHEQNSYVVQTAYAATQTGNLKIAGPMISVDASHRMPSGLHIGGFMFLDRLKLSGENDFRPLQTLFSPATPYVRPVDARFGGLDGTMQDYGVGIHMSGSLHQSWLGLPRWTSGLLWQRVSLRDYRLDYELLSGSSLGARGKIDFDADYSHLTPFAGLEWAYAGERWSIGPHVLFAWPIPRRGVAGHITGAGFDLRGNTEQVGGGKHFGDPSLTIGLDVTYLPAHLTVDLGTLLTQRFLEPLVHEGIERNWLLSFRWRR